MKRTLSIEERILLRSFLLTLGGDYPTLVLIQSTIDTILSEREIKRLDVQQIGSTVTWDKNLPNQSIDVMLGEEIIKIVVEALKKLNEAKKLDFSTKILYEMFVLSSSSVTTK